MTSHNRAQHPDPPRAQVDGYEAPPARVPDVSCTPAPTRCTRSVLAHCRLRYKARR